MTKRREVEDLQKVTLNLFEGDYRALQELYPDNGAGKIVRLLVRRHLEEIKEKIHAA